MVASSAQFYRLRSDPGAQAWGKYQSVNLIILENLFRVQGLIGCRLPVKKDGGLLVFPVRNASVFTSVIAAVPQFVVYCHRHLVFVVEYSGYSLLLFLLFLLFNGSFFSFSFLTSVLYRV